MPGEEADVTGQVGRGFSAALRLGSGTATLRLEPESLGRVTIRIDVRDGVVSADLEATDDQARRLLTESIDRLRDGLEARGLSVDRLEVSRGRDGEDGRDGGGDRSGREDRGDETATDRHGDGRSPDRQHFAQQAGGRGEPSGRGAPRHTAGRTDPADATRAPMPVPGGDSLTVLRLDAIA